MSIGAYRVLMKRFLDVIHLVRAGNCLMASVTVLVGVHLSGHPVFTLPVLMTAAGTFLICAAGNTFNDVVDLATDQISHPRRVLVRGAISSRAAVWIALLCNFVAIGLALLVNRHVLLLAFFSAILLIAYNLWLKRVPLVGNAVVASLAGLALWAGGLVNPKLVFMGECRILAGGVLAFCLHLIREIIKDILDMEGDQAVGIRTLPNRIGVSGALAVSLGIGLLLVIATGAPVLLGWFNWRFAVITLILIDLPILGMLNLVWMRPNPARLRLTSAALKAAMGLGLLALVLGV